MAPDIPKKAILNFRRALLGVLPSVEAAEIPWRRPDSYDEWDQVATALYDSLVISVLRWEFPEPVWDELNVPPYDMLLHDYGHYSMIEVLPTDGTMCRVFHALGTENEPFDTVEFRVVAADGRPISPGIETLPLKATEFRLKLTPAFAESLAACEAKNKERSKPQT